MGLVDRKIKAFTKPVSNLADRPQMSAAQLKAWFDSNTEVEVRDAFNGLIDDLLNEKSAGEIGAMPFNGVEGNTVQAQMEEVEKKIDDLVMGEIPDGSITTRKLENGAITPEKMGFSISRTVSSIMVPTEDGTLNQGFRSGDGWIVPKTLLKNQIANYDFKDVNNWESKHGTLAPMQGTLEVRGDGSDPVVGAYTLAGDMELLALHRCVLYLELTITNTSAKAVYVKLLEEGTKKPLMETVTIKDITKNESIATAVVFDVPQDRYVGPPQLLVETEYFSAGGSLDMVTQIKVPVLIDMTMAVDDNVLVFNKGYAEDYFKEQGAKRHYEIEENIYTNNYNGEWVTVFARKDLSNITKTAKDVTGKIVLTQETAALYGLSGEGGTVDGALKKATAITKTYPVAAGNSIVAGDVVDVVDGKVTKNTTKNEAISLTTATDGQPCTICYDGGVSIPTMKAGKSIISEGVMAHCLYDGWVDVVGHWTHKQRFKLAQSVYINYNEWNKTVQFPFNYGDMSNVDMIMFEFVGTAKYTTGNSLVLNLKPSKNFDSQYCQMFYNNIQNSEVPIKSRKIALPTYFRGYSNGEVGQQFVFVSETTMFYPDSGFVYLDSYITQNNMGLKVDGKLNIYKMKSGV